MVGEIKLSITRSWVQNLSLPDERSNRETSRRIGFYNVYLVSLQGLPVIQLYFIYIDLHRLLLFHKYSSLTLINVCEQCLLQFLKIVPTTTLFKFSRELNAHYFLVLVEF